MRALQLQRFEREQYAESMDIRVKLTLEALRMIARHVSGYPGRKNLIWLSSAFPLAITPDANLTMLARFSGMRNYGADMNAAASALTDAQIAVYPVDPRGLETQALFDPQSKGKSNPFSEGATLNRESNVRFSTQESMQDLAQQTGGKVCLNNNDLSECVKRAIDDSSSYYELSYYPADKNWHGEFRRISVKTTRPGVHLSFRQGYFAREADSTISASNAKDTDASGRFLSVTDKTTPAPQPLHFRADDTRSVDVYLDAQEGVKYSGEVAVDASAKPFLKPCACSTSAKIPQRQSLSPDFQPGERCSQPRAPLGDSHRLIQVESDFDLHPAIFRFSILAKRGFHLPFLYLCQRLFSQSQSRILDHFGINNPSVGGHCHVQPNCSLIFCGPRFFGIAGWRTANALRRAHSVHSGSSHSTLGSCVIIRRLLRYYGRAHRENTE